MDRQRHVREEDKFREEIVVARARPERHTDTRTLPFSEKLESMLPVSHSPTQNRAQSRGVTEKQKGEPHTPARMSNEIKTKEHACAYERRTEHAVQAHCSGYYRHQRPTSAQRLDMADDVSDDGSAARFSGRGRSDGAVVPRAAGYAYEICGGWRPQAPSWIPSCEGLRGHSHRRPN